MLRKQNDEEVKVCADKENDDEDLPLDYASVKVFCILSGLPIMGWFIGVCRWWYFGVSIQELNLDISPQEIGLVAFIMSIVFVMIGVMTTWMEPTVSNFCINIAFPVVFVCVLFTAEKNFVLTSVIVILSFLLPFVFGVRKYLSWKSRKYLSSERRRYERLKIYMRVRKMVLILLAVGVVPWTLWNWFSGPKYDFVHPRYSSNMDFKHIVDKNKYPLLEKLDKMWDGLSSEERLSAVNELASYECETMGVTALPVEAEKIESVSDNGLYDSEKGRIVLDAAQLKDEAFSKVVSDVISACRYKYQHELADCVRELERSGKDVRGMSDFSEANKYWEAEEMYAKGIISRKQYMDVLYGDVVQWRKKAIEHLKKEFEWKTKGGGSLWEKNW